MNITTTKNGGQLTAAVTGRIDTATSPELEQFIAENIDGVTELILDLKDTSYISSAGLRVLLVAQKKMNEQGTMKVVNVNDYIREIFEVTGFSDILTIA